VPFKHRLAWKMSGYMGLTVFFSMEYLSRLSKLSKKCTLSSGFLLFMAKSMLFSHNITSSSCIQAGTGVISVGAGLPPQEALIMIADGRTVFSFMSNCALYQKHLGHNLRSTVLCILCMFMTFAYTTTSHRTNVHDKRQIYMTPGLCFQSADKCAVAADRLHD